MCISWGLVASLKQGNYISSDMLVRGKVLCCFTNLYLYCIDISFILSYMFNVLHISYIKLSCIYIWQIPARKQQIVMARQQQKVYDSHVRLCNRQTGMNDTIYEHQQSSPPTPTNTLLCTTCHPERAPSRRRRLCSIMWSEDSATSCIE